MPGWSTAKIPFTAAQPGNLPGGCPAAGAMEAWKRGGCLASEMESAALFILAAARGLRAGCVLEVLWNQEREAAGLENPRAAGTGDAIDTAAAALALLIAADQKRGEARG